MIEHTAIFVALVFIFCALLDISRSDHALGAIAVLPLYEADPPEIWQVHIYRLSSVRVEQEDH